MPREGLQKSSTLSLRCRLLVTSIVVFFAPIGSCLAAISISVDASQNVDCTSGVCTPTAPDAVLNVSDLENLLAGGNVEITTTGTGVEADDINVAATLSWSNGSLLSLSAYRSISIGSPVTVGGSGGLSILKNSGRNGGLLSFPNGGDIVFQNLASQMTIDGQPYTLVNSIASLAQAIAAAPNGKYALAASYDAGNDGTYKRAPVGTAFTGILNGLGNTISNLTIKAPVDESVGLFATVQKGEICNFGLVNVGLIGTKYTRKAGGLAGESTNEAMQQTYVSGNVSVGHEVYVGGLVGYATGGSIDRSWSSATVSGGLVIGGLVGNSDVGNVISRSYATGPVSGTYGVAAGGLVGQTLGTVTTSYATGSISGLKNSSAGGLIGVNAGGSISNSYATGSVSSPYSVGGLLGYNNGSADKSYSTGSVTGATYSGGFVGYDNATKGFTKTYWDTTTSGIGSLTEGAGNVPNDPGITGKSSDEFESGLPKGFSAKVWGLSPNINGGLPYLLSNPPANQ